ncbi:WbqC family protein [Pseudoalteromonas aurantia]|uniref:WbqC family protein n=1 Tax=Pseudoalteromonas aurantia TaxID=43654 RepID=A0ABY2VXI4_9GAMM|nr:WbqC family protein [Pseudoalteromonas aurantia]TMO63268.1 hypothetical protein CWC18_08535 [Pseudoalteromonas aurantia]TMO74414.1 hypothetical protein CWC20_10780 [Pseudoalteromonas aurantia]
MILAVMQPTYIPWLGYFDLINSADQFLFLDDVKLEKSDWHVRNKIKGNQGEIMLSQVVSTPNGRMGSVICDTEFKEKHPWRKKHLKSIEMNYRKAPFFNSIFGVIQQYFLNECNNLADFNIGLTQVFLKSLEIQTSVNRSSKLPKIAGVKDERLANFCDFFKSDKYLSPRGASAYIERHSPGGLLAKSGVEVFYQQFEHPKYYQCYPPFVSHLGVVDALMNLGADQTKQLIESGHKQPLHYSELYTSN